MLLKEVPVTHRTPIYLMLAALGLCCAARLRLPPPHGDPMASARSQPRFGTVPARAGIDYPVRVTTPDSETPEQLAHRLIVSSRTPVSILSRDAHHFFIMPKPAWPSNREVTLKVAGQSADVRIHTDEGQEILINLSDQSLAALQNGRTIRTMHVSTGTPNGWATPTGTFWIYKRVRDDHMVGGRPGDKDHWDVEHVPYAQYFTGGVAIHGAWWNHRFDRPVSHGCVQVPTDEGPNGPTGDPPDALWLWKFADIGTPVAVAGTTPTTRAAGVGAEAAPLPYPTNSRGPTAARFGAS